MTARAIRIFIICLLPFASLFQPGQAVPNVFSPGDPARADEVNENFSDLESRINNLDSRFNGFGGYGVQFSDDGDPKNVVVLATEFDNGDIAYSVRSRYATSTEQISINGVSTQRPFIANYVFVYVSAIDGITDVSNYIEAPDTENYVRYNVEETSYDPDTLAKTVTDDTKFEDWSACGGSGFISLCLIEVTLSATGEFHRNYQWSQVRALTGPITINGMTFNDVRLEHNLVSGYLRARARGIGTVLQTPSTGNSDDTTRRVIFYRANGVTGGSLAGTPFDSGQPLEGLFF